LVDVERRISVADVGDEKLAGSDFRIAEEDPPRTRVFPVIVASTGNPVRSVECFVLLVV